MASAKWTKEGKKLDASRSSERQEIDRTVLEIVNPSQEDLGSYTCEASNSEGEISEVLINKENNLIPVASVLSMEEPSKEQTDALEEKMDKAAEALVTTEDRNSSSMNTISSSLVLLFVVKSLASSLSQHY